jgi:hypothetical protein
MPYPELLLENAKLKRTATTDKVDILDTEEFYQYM